MSAGSATGWERHHDGAYISIPIAPVDFDEKRTWCGENCIGDFLIVLGPKIIFQLREDAALAMMFWRPEEV